MNLGDIVIVGLAVWHMLEVWHHSEFFAEWRARVEIMQDGNLKYFLKCMFCMSPWVSLFLIAPYQLFPLPAYVFAAARLANLGNDLTHAWCRTPRAGTLSEDPISTFYNEPEDEGDSDNGHRQAAKGGWTQQGGEYSDGSGEKGV